MRSRIRGFVRRPQRPGSWTVEYPKILEKIEGLGVRHVTRAQPLRNDREALDDLGEVDLEFAA